MSDWFNELHIFGLASFALALFILQGWLRDLRFYQSRNWDYAESTGRNYSAYGIVGGNGMPNRQRVTVGFPLTLAVVTVIGLVCVTN
ncbi:MAG: hypothetical protein KGO53_12185 [Alphaproteobacteria bacterium]|nr:hypothetical protein [Alphaproteobacteria bacterium]